MNRQLYFALILMAAIFASCSKADELIYDDVARIQLADTATVSSTFVYKPVTLLRDTVYIKVNTIGDIKNYDRTVKLIQIPEAGVLNVAVAGKHYLPTADETLKKLMVIKANAVTAMIPVVLLRDASLKDNSFRLRLELAPNEEFSLGEIQMRGQTIVFSDRLERFFSWRVDGSQAPAFNTFGKYSTRKHQFMVDVLREQIDEAWYQLALSIGAVQSYKNLVKDKLNIYNSDPANIASGKAPMRETDVVGSPLVTFP